MKVRELRTHSPKELRAMLVNLRDKARAMRFDIAQGKVKNTASLRGVRKDIARIETLIREEELRTGK